jgi:hypothetical protein
VSGLRKPNNDIRPSIAEAEAEANVEGTLKKTNIFSGSPSFPPPSDKLASSALESKALLNQALHSSSPLVSSSWRRYTPQPKDSWHQRIPVDQI